MVKNGEAMETATDFMFLDSQITSDGSCRHKIERLFLLGSKAMEILKSRDITLATKVCLWFFL